jgi:spermidine synthase
VSLRFEELDFQETAFGEISLRRRIEPATGVDVFEVKLGDEFLMSSLFTVAEEELSHLGLAAASGERLDVMVGGLGLGYTAVAALADPRVSRLVVVEALPAVIDWHERGLLPVSGRLTGDARTKLVLADFFAMMREVPAADAERYDVLLIDIDHSPRHLLDPGHADFYAPEGLRRLAGWLRPGGVFALWSDDPPDDAYLADLDAVFEKTAAHVVEFDNFLTGGTSTNTVYVATLPAG